HGHPATALVDAGSGFGHYAAGYGRGVVTVVGHPVHDELAPPIDRRLLHGSGRDVDGRDLASPAGEEAPSQRDRQSGRLRSGHAPIDAEPGGQTPGTTWNPDQRHPLRGELLTLLTQLLLVQRLPDRRGTGVAVRVDQAGQEEPTVVHGFRS